MRDLNVDVTVQPGEDKEITLEGAKAGNFDLVCRFHQGSGMKGTVTVQ